MMNSKEIFEEYTQASNKMKYVKDKAKSLDVYDSDIICELLKSGYKFEELKRANKGTYNAGMKKYEKWKENGSPEDEDADALEQYAESESHCPENDTAEQAEELSLELEIAPYVPIKDSKQLMDEENYKPEDYIAHLEKVLKEQEEKITELISTNQYLEDQKKNLEAENNQLNAQLAGLELKVSEIDGALKEERVRHSKREIYDEMLRNYNDAMLMNKQLESQLALEKADSESDSRTLKEARNECEELRSKLQKAERYILNRIYEDCEEVMK